MAELPLGRVQIAVALAGVGTLAVEMVAPRLLAPAFGTSQPIWAAVIGMTLLYLAIGYHLGGRWADAGGADDADLLARVIWYAGLATAVIAPIAPPMISFARVALQQLAVGGFVGALGAALILFAAPVILLASVSPLAARLALRQTDPAVVGGLLGRLSALATIGSLAGTFLTSLWLIPQFGSTQALLIIAAGLIILAAWLTRRWRRLLGLLLVAGLLVWRLVAGPPSLAAGCNNCQVIATIESANNMIQVAERVDATAGPQTLLLLNEGLAVHSVYNQRYAQSGDTRDLLTGGGPWDYFVVVPYVLPDRQPDQVRRMALLGAGAGTAAEQFLAIYGPDAVVDAVEIDQQIIDVARTSFGMRDSVVAGGNPNYHVHVADGRTWLATQSGLYDVIGVDAYHQPYIPFHLTTVEFFRMVRDHLAPNGVVVLNAGLGADGDIRLAQTLATTMLEVFPNVFVLETTQFGNWMLVGSMQHIGDGAANFAANYQQIEQPALRTTMALVQGFPFLSNQRGDVVLYDDHAPVERLVDEMIFGAVTK